MPNSKQIVYLSQAQYQELITNQSITVNGVTVTYDENDIYVTPQAEPVTDVRINGTSVASGGIANIPVASTEAPGTVRLRTQAFSINSSTGLLDMRYAESGDAKGGANVWRPITASIQHQSAFYGLAKAAGDSTQSTSLNTVGIYTPEAKGAIQQMLGVSDLIATAENSLVASKAYAIGDVFTANGKLYKATAAIAADAAIILDGANANCEETNVGDGFVKFTDYATSTTPGIAKINGYGLHMFQGQIIIVKATDSEIKTGIHNYDPIVPSQQHKSVFYGLAKAAGDTTQAESDNAVGTYTNDAKSAIRTMLGAVGDVQINETSIVSNGIAEIPVATSSTFGAIKVSSGLYMTSSGELRTSSATATVIKNGVDDYRPIVSSNLNTGVFYGLAKAAGDTTQSASSNAVGQYTDNAKASIKAMLGVQDGSTGTVDVSGATPTITAVENTRYVCGEVTSLSFTPAASGICIVRFTSGSTVTVLTLPNTVKFPEWFDPTSLETNTIYEICITDGVYGAVMSWAL